MESVESSLLTSLTGELKSDDYIQPHYKECYRLAIDRLVSGGSDKYQEFLKGERIGSFLSEEELLFITENAEQFRSQNDAEEINDPADTESSSGTYWPVHSDVETPDLDLGWPDILNEHLQTNIDLLFHPARQNSPTIKEVVRKRIQEARQVIAIVMDIFTDIDIFKEVVDASIRGIPVYVLLNDFHLKSFLKMAENQDVKIQQLRNMRVRTVKGQDYFCRSGAKFHGAMEQRFLLVDCHTTIFGSYSFTWSFEKINLSMVQVITGHLVKTFDEEFRTLYARSTVPPDLCPVEGLYQRNGPQGRQILPKSHSGQIERKDQLRHTLDTVYRKTCERKLGARDFEERRYDEDPNKHGPLIQNGIGVHNRMTQLQSTEAMDYLKRHSYAGERQDEYVPQNMRPRASNWNISREAVNSTNNYHTNNYLQGPQVFRGQNVRQSYNGKDKEVMAVQQNMPTLENTSKSFMRTLRIESYLKNPDGPYGDSCDYLDQFESQDKASCYMQRGMRSSYVFRSTKPEQMEPNRHINNSSTCFTSSAGPNTPMHYSSMQWNPKGAPENRLNSEEFMLKRPSLQMLDGNHCNKSYGSGRNSYQSAYTSLDRAQSGNMIPKPESLTDSWYKRHSVADPRSNTHESSGHVYGSLTRMQINRSTAGISTQNGGYKPNLNEDQRSVSHYDVKSIPSTKSPSTSSWKDPTSMTVSTAFQEVKSQDSTAKSRSSQHFIDKSSNKIKSIFNIPVKKGDSMQSLETLSLKSGTSTDTITAEDEVTMSGGGEKTHQTSTDSVRSSSEHQRSQTKDDHQKSSKPRFRAEERRIPLQISLPRITTHKKPSILDKSTRPGLDTQSWSKSRSTENRLYSRFEPFCSLEKKQSPLSGHSSYSQDKPGSLSRGGAGIEHNVSRTVRGHHENKLEKFFHRVGNLIHKNK